MCTVFNVISYTTWVHGVQSVINCFVFIQSKYDLSTLTVKISLQSKTDLSNIGQNMAIVLKIRHKNKSATI